MKTLNITLTDEDFDRLSEAKQSLDLTWQEAMQQSAKLLEAKYRNDIKEHHNEEAAAGVQ